jgi:hypothetical protein
MFEENAYSPALEYDVPCPPRLWKPLKNSGVAALTVTSLSSWIERVMLFVVVVSSLVYY